MLPVWTLQKIRILWSLFERLVTKQDYAYVDGIELHLSSSMIDNRRIVASAAVTQALQILGFRPGDRSCRSLSRVECAHDYSLEPQLGSDEPCNGSARPSRP